MEEMVSCDVSESSNTVTVFKISDISCPQSLHFIAEHGKIDSSYTGYHEKLPQGIYTAMCSMAMMTLNTRVLRSKIKYAAAYF